MALTARARRARAAGAPARAVPVGLIPPAAIGAAFLIIPTVALLIRVPWSDLGRIYSDHEVLQALELSLETATITTGIALVLGVPLAWMLARLNVPGIGLLRVAVTMPLVFPPVVGGVVLFLAFGRQGILGRLLNQWFGITIAFSRVGVILSETLVAMPFLVITVEGAFRAVSRGLEEAATTLGASRFTVFRRVTLPLIGPSLVAGSILCWARALGEFGATITFNGSLPGVSQTLPIYISFALDGGDPQAQANAEGLSLILVLVALIILGSLRGRWLRTASSA